MKSNDPIVDGLCDKLREDSCGDVCLESVIAKLIQRSKAGQQKYGTNLARADLTREQWLTHAQEEAMDLANYLEVLIQRKDALVVFQGMQDAALAIATTLEAELNFPRSQSPSHLE